MTPWQDARTHLYLASVSGGKDSAAMALWMMEQNIPFEPVFMDTGWECDQTIDYLHGPLEQAIGPITVLQSPKGGMAELCRKKGMFPNRMQRFCTQLLKVHPIRDYIRSLDRDDVVNVVGLRAEESEARSRLPEHEESTQLGCDVWRPIIRCTEEDVIAIHQRHGLRPNPLYLQGAMRVGCWPCIFARKAEIRHIAETDPARIDMIEALEVEVGRAAQARAAARGETLANLPTFFQTPMPTRNEDGTRSGECWPIRRVVEWAMTRHGGRQMEMFAPSVGDIGCTRWGFCEVKS